MIYICFFGHFFLKKPLQMAAETCMFSIEDSQIHGQNTYILQFLFKKMKERGLNHSYISSSRAHDRVSSGEGSTDSKYS